MYLLDTNMCIFLKNRKPVHVLERLKAVIHKDIFISSISVAELQYGVYNSRDVEKNRTALVEFLAPFDILNFDDDDAEQFGLIRAQLRKEGKIIGPYDMLIAAQAIAKSLILITNNSDEFNRVNGLIIEDWK